MAFRLVGGFPDNFVVEATVAAGTAIAEGDLLVVNGNVLQQATSSATILTVFGVAAETITTSDTKIKVIPVCQGQLWEADANATTASTQLYESMALTNCTTVNNSDTNVTINTGLFRAWAFPSTSKILGEFSRINCETHES